MKPIWLYVVLLTLIITGAVLSFCLYMAQAGSPR